MSITFTCTGCGKRFQVPPEAAGRTVTCAGCGTKLRISGQTATGEAAKTPAMGLDWDLMQSASKPEPEVTQTATPKDPNAVDWEAIAAPLSAQTTEGTSAKMVRRKTAGFSDVDESGQPLDATNNRFNAGRVDYFILEALMALPAGLTYLPQIFAIVMIGVGVGVIVTMMAMGFGYLLGKSPNPELWLVITMKIVLLMPLVCFYGYVARFWTTVADETSEGNMGAPLPNMGLGEMVRAIILWVLFFVTYILPIVTIPLAPAAFLAMGRTNGYQAFNLPWVARSSLRSWVHVLIALCFVPFFIAIGIFVASIVFPPVAQQALSMTKNLPHEAQDFYIGLSFQFIMVPVVMLFVASMCRMIGVIGKFNPMIYETLPKRGKWHEGLLGGLIGLTIFMLITMPLISTQSQNVVTPMVRYVMGKSAMQTREEARLGIQRSEVSPVKP